LASMPDTLRVEGLRVLRGRLPVLHGVDLCLGDEPLGMLGRNGAGKSTFCAALMGLLPVAAGSIVFNGVNLVGKSAQQIAALGITLVPQGRRVFRSLTVDEHLRLMQGLRPGPWTRERVYAEFPRLAERRGNFGNQLSGGEQQMLAIGRALMTNPRLMVLDEPSEGLAPTIVDDLLRTLAALRDSGVAILLVEQNLRVGTRAAPQVAVMAAGQIVLVTDSKALMADEQMQQRYLGVSAH
jgi:branched-chain amino acid transport system ATP-binding protein